MTQEPIQASPYFIHSRQQQASCEHSCAAGSHRECVENIYSIHKNGEPSARAFFQKYGEHMRRSISDLPPMTASQIIRTLKKVKPSSPGMDHIAPLELKYLSEWAPDLFVHIAVLLTTWNPQVAGRHYCQWELSRFCQRLMMHPRMHKIFDHSQF